MKTKELIRQLQEADPSGELDVSVGNLDIHFVHIDPGYWDGSQEILVRNEKEKYYNIVGGRYNSSKNKVEIRTLSFHDAMLNSSDFPIDYTDLTEQRRVSYQARDNDCRKFIVDMEHEHELEYFIKHCKKRAGEFSSDLDGLEEVCRQFFQQHISPYDLIPKDIPFLGTSYVDRRNIQWGREVDLTMQDGDWVLTKKNTPTVS